MSAKRFSVGVATALLVLVATGAVRAEVATGDLSAGSGYYAYADVIDVTPRYGWHEVSEPVLHCVESGRYGMSGHRSSHGFDRYGDGDRGRYAHDGRYRERGEGAAGLVGGLLGGLIGHQFGGGNGKTALTIAGAALGASVARGYVRERRYDDGARWAQHHEPVRHCTESYQTRRVRGVNGYDVTYRYHGATFHKWVDEHPGDVIRVQVDVEPMAEG